MPERLELNIKTREASKLECLFGYHQWGEPYLTMYNVNVGVLIQKCGICGTCKVNNQSCRSGSIGYMFES